MSRKSWIIIGAVVVALIILAGSFATGVVVGTLIPTDQRAGVDGSQGLPGLPFGGNPAGSQGQPVDGSTPGDLGSLFEPFWQSWRLVHELYVDQPVDDVALMRGALQGMLGALGDEHTSYLDPAMFERSNASLNGEEYEGIGAWVDITGDYLKIISPMPGSPAEKAGLKPGDQIIAINGEDMTGIDGEAARQRVLGPRGSVVLLTVNREGEEQPLLIEVTRDKIIVPTVTGNIVEGTNIAYVRLYTFGDDTSDELRKTLRDLLDQKPDGLILDLRYNGGGYLDTAVGVASEFIGDGVILYEQFGDGRRNEFKARSGGLALDIPLVVLVNEGSASASEIVAGAIQDLGRGQLVGVTTYGKGSVQTYTELVNDQGAVRVTIARWLTPNGRTIHKLGLTPDVVVELTDEDAAAGRDPQLDKAVEILSK